MKESGDLRSTLNSQKEKPLPAVHQALRMLMVKALRRTHGNVNEAASLIQMSRTTMYRRMKRFNIPTQDDTSVDIVGSAIKPDENLYQNEKALK